MKNNESNESIEKARHIATDWEREDCLKPEAVFVRLNRLEKGIYDVEISILDRDYTFESDVTGELAKRGFKTRTSGRGNGISVWAPKGFRAPKGFVKVESL